MSAARADGRTPGMMRQLKLERAFLSRADGSARWEQGEALANPRPRTTPLGTSLARLG
jgi:ribonuclease PH